MVAPLIKWDTLEHVYTNKSKDWYWAVGIIAATIAALAFIFGEIIFGIFIIIAATALCVHAARIPRTIHCEINDRGVSMDNTFYPFVDLESFWTIDDPLDPRIIIKSRKIMMPFIVVPIDEIEVEDARQILLRYIAETEHLEPLSLKILEKLGF